VESVPFARPENWKNRQKMKTGKKNRIRILAKFRTANKWKAAQKRQNGKEPAKIANHSQDLMS
jgi:hypothetical protein